MAIKEPLPIVLLHAFPYDSLMWEPQAHRLSRLTQVITPSYPGFGGVPADSGPPSLDLWAAHLLEGIAPRRFVVAGNAIGGYLALSMIRQAPQRIAGFALINSRSIPDPEEKRVGRMRLIAEIRKDGVEAFRAQSIANEPRRDNGTPPPERLFASMTAQGVIAATELLASRPDARPALHDIGVPSVVIHGVTDPMISLNEARALAEAIPASAFVPILEAGHVCGLDNPDEVSEALEMIVRRCSTT